MCRDAIILQNADRQAHRPCPASSSRTWRRWTGTWWDIGVGTRPPLARRGRGSGGGYLGRQQGGGPGRRGCGGAAREGGSMRHRRRRQGSVDEDLRREHGACTRRCDLRRRGGEHPGWTATYRPGSRPHGPSDSIRAARISQYGVKPDLPSHGFRGPHLSDPSRTSS